MGANFLFIIIFCLCFVLQAMPNIKTFAESNPQYANVLDRAVIENYSDDPTLLDHIRESIKDNHIKILMIGDSHVAGDFMSHELRSIIGNIDSIGFVYPIMPSYHQNLLLQYNSDGFDILDSRLEMWDDYPFGGIIARSNKKMASINLIPNEYIFGSNAMFRFKMLFKNGNTEPALMILDSNNKKYLISSSNVNTWEFVTITLSFPIRILSLSDNVMIGGYIIDNDSGNVVQSMGINGVQSDFWRRWDIDTLRGELDSVQYDIVILCYGSNEAMRSSFNLAYYMDNYRQLVSIIKESNKDAMIIMMSPPNVYIKSNRRYKQSSIFEEIRSGMKRIAIENKIFLFDMSNFMGELGGKNKWIQEGLSKKDVHLTPLGYRFMAAGLYSGLIKLMQ